MDACRRRDRQAAVARLADRDAVGANDRFHGRNRVIDNAPPLVAGLPEAGHKQPHWTALEFTDPV